MFKAARKRSRERPPEAGPPRALCACTPRACLRHQATCSRCTDNAAPRARGPRIVIVYAFVYAATPAALPCRPATVDLDLDKFGHAP